jgi:hypothetical protein
MLHKLQFVQIIDGTHLGKGLRSVPTFQNESQAKIWTSSEIIFSTLFLAGPSENCAKMLSQTGMLPMVQVQVLVHPRQSIYQNTLC